MNLKEISLPKLISDLTNNESDYICLPIKSMNLDMVKELSTAISNSSSLKKVKINGSHASNAIVISILKGIQANGKIENLIISNTLINDNIAAQIRDLIIDNIFLTELSFSYSINNSRSIALITSALLANKVLVKLNLSFNRLKDDALESIMQLIKKNDTLLSLDLRSNNFSDKHLSEIKASCKDNLSLQYIDFYGNKKIQNSNIAEIKDYGFANQIIFKEKNPIIKSNLIGKRLEKYSVPSLYALSFYKTARFFTKQQLDTVKESIPEIIYADLCTFYKN